MMRKKLYIQDCGPDGAKDWFHLTRANGDVIWSSGDKQFMDLIVTAVNEYEQLHALKEHIKYALDYLPDSPNKAQGFLEHALKKAGK